MNTNPTSPHDAPQAEPSAPFFTRARWGAIVAGVFIAIAIQLLFTLVGVSVGMATIDPSQDGSYTGAFGLSAGIWTLVGVAVAMFCGGWVAGRMAGVPWSLDAMMHGAVVWALTAIFSFYLMTTAIGSLVSAAGGIVGGALRESVRGAGSVASAAGSALGAAADAAPGGGAPPAELTGEVQDRAQKFLRDMGISRGTVQQFLESSRQRLGTAAESALVNPDQAYGEAQKALTDIYQRGTSILSDVERQDAARALAENTGLSQEQAAAAIDNWAAQAQQLRDRAAQAGSALQAQGAAVGRTVERTVEQTAESVASGIAAATGWLAAAYVLGLAMAIFGGKFGEPHDKTPLHGEDRDPGNLRAHPAH